MLTNRLSAAMYSSVHLENCAKIACPGGDLPLAAMGAIPAPPTRQVVDKIATREL